MRVSVLALNITKMPVKKRSEECLSFYIQYSSIHHFKTAIHLLLQIF